MVTQRFENLSSEKLPLQIGIRAKVLTLSLDGPIEWSLDWGWEEKLCLEDLSDVVEVLFPSLAEDQNAIQVHYYKWVGV